MTERFKRVGIMGGTFDPIHYGHLVTAEGVRAKFDLDYVIFVPAGNPPHKKDYKVTDARHRYLMTVLATVTNPYFEVSRIEIDREGYSYTVDTLVALKQMFDTGTELFFITGADAILEILTWKQVDRLLSVCKFVAATRPGYNPTELEQKIVALKQAYGHEIYSVEVPAMAISSTDIRNRVRYKKPIKYLVPEPVEYYIIKNKLYIDG